MACHEFWRKLLGDERQTGIDLGPLFQDNAQVTHAQTSGSHTPVGSFFLQSLLVFVIRVAYLFVEGPIRFLTFDTLDCKLKNRIKQAVE
jgi:hypothetical protein